MSSLLLKSLKCHEKLWIPTLKKKFLDVHNYFQIFQIGSLRQCAMSLELYNFSKNIFGQIHFRMTF